MPMMTYPAKGMTYDCADEMWSAIAPAMGGHQAPPPTPYQHE